MQKKQNRQLHMGKVIAVMMLLWLGMAFQTEAAEEKSGVCGDNLTWTISGSTLTITGEGEMMDYADGALPPWYGMASSIKTIKLPNGITSIGDYAFFGCSNVANVTIPESVTEIGACAFGQCKNLLYVKWSEGITKIGEGAFQECESLTRIAFPKSVVEIDEKAFYRCYSLRQITVPKTVTILGPSVFAYCTDLVRASINAQLMELPKWTFYGCTKLTDVSLASSIVATGEYAFLFCENLKGVYTQGGNMDTLHKLEKTIVKGDGAPSADVVKAYDMPDTSILAIDDGKIYTQITVIQRGGFSVVVEHLTDYSKDENVERAVLSATLKREQEWTHVVSQLEEILADKNQESIKAEITLIGMNSVKGSYLKELAREDIELLVTLSNDSVAKIAMKDMRSKDFGETFDFSKRAVMPESGDKQEPVTKPEPEAEKEPSKEDESGSSLQEIPDVESGDPTLMDEEGTKYNVSEKRFSRWGITGKQFATYSAIIIGAVVVVVTIVMYSLDFLKKSKEIQEKYEKKNKK